jgi:hypothetical protein
MPNQHNVDRSTVGCLRPFTLLFAAPELTSRLNKAIVAAQRGLPAM